MERIGGYQFIGNKGGGKSSVEILHKKPVWMSPRKSWDMKKKKKKIMGDDSQRAKRKK